MIMKIYLTASKNSFDKVASVKSALEELGHIITPPNGFATPELESTTRNLSPEEYSNWKAEMIREDGRIVESNDAVLVLNFEKHGQQNYVGGATFLEMFKAFDSGKKLYLYNPIPGGMLSDEIIGLQALVIDGDLERIV
jgi:hypothetical protein